MRGPDKNYQLFLRGGLPLLAHTMAFRGTHKNAILAKPASIDDWWFEEWLSCVCTRVGRLYFIEQALILYRQHGNQTSGGFDSHTSVQPSITHSESKHRARIRKLSYCLEHLGERAKPDVRAAALAEYLRFLQKSPRR